jgi:Fur family transcriptional regulator, peroxide stress response regulator
MAALKLLGENWHSDYASKRLAEFADNCRKKGLAVTPQRLAVIKALLASKDHPRADKIYAVVRREHPHISLATVHRTLETLCETGEARKVTPLHVSARYDGNVSPHHHIVCVRCRQVRDVDVPAIDGLLRGHAKLGDFKLLGASIEVLALCKRCQKIQADAHARRSRSAGQAAHVQ